MCEKLQFIIKHYTQAGDIIWERYIHTIKGHGFAFDFHEMLVWYPIKWVWLTGFNVNA